MTKTSPTTRPTAAPRIAAALRLVGRTVPAVLLLTGTAVLVLGVSMWSKPAAVILAGVMLIVAGVLSLERGTRDGEGRR